MASNDKPLRSIPSRIVFRRDRFLLAACVSLLYVGQNDSSWGQDPRRVTPTVELIEQIGSAVVPLFSQAPDGKLGSGSGAVIHPRGYILTADHVTLSYPGVALFGLRRVAYRVVGRLPEKDLAIIKVPEESVDRVVKLGRSHDLMAGEPILVAGNPSGRGIVFSTGIVNSPSIDPSWPSVLVKSYWRNDLDEAKRTQVNSTGGRSTFIQFDASTNRGNSGGPLTNQLGELIGVVSQKSFDEEAINWAIPVDAIRLLGPYLLQAEETGGFEVGLELEPLSNHCVVASVRPGSSADEAGILPGDRILSVDSMAVHSDLDYRMQIAGKRVGQSVSCRFARGDESREVELVCRKYDRYEPITDLPLTDGLDYSLYRGRFPMMPDFATLEPESTGVADTVTYEGIVDEEATEYAIVFQGYLEFPTSGLYRVELGSDDGSKFYLEGDVIIDNDLPHPYQKLSRWVRVPAGPIAFRLEYAETAGQKALDLVVRRDHDSEDEVPMRFLRERIQPSQPGGTPLDPNKKEAPASEESKTGAST
ncbi:MAG: trypsin-like peptidase domain-containing protein [Planctomycetota bacterium]